jgi:hypothetical protein
VVARSYLRLGDRLGNDLGTALDGTAVLRALEDDRELADQMRVHQVGVLEEACGQLRSIAPLGERDHDLPPGEAGLLGLLHRDHARLDGGQLLLRRFSLTVVGVRLVRVLRLRRNTRSDHHHPPQTPHDAILSAISDC